MKLFLAKIGIGIGLLFASLFGYHQSSSLGNYNPTGGGTYRLQSSVSSTQSTITLTSFKEPISAIPYTMTYLNSSIEYATIDPLNSSSKEFISFTGITQNSDNTATLTGVIRGLGFSYPYTASTTLAQPHSGQSILILSNPPQLYTQQLILANQVSTSSVSTVISSTSPWRYDLVPANHAIGTYVSTTSELASVAYVNSVALVSAPNASTGAKGVVQIASTGQTTIGTASGSTGALLVVPASLFNTTASSATIVPVTGPTGKLDPMFIGTSSVNTYNYGAVMTFNGTTIVASSTQYTTNVGNIIATSTIKFTNVSGVASSSILQTNTAGTLTWGSPQLSYVNFPADANGASTTQAYFTLPANSLGLNGYVEININYENFAHQGSNQDFFEIAYGNSTTTINLPWTAGSGSKDGYVRVVLGSNGATNSQKMGFQIMGILQGNKTTTETLVYSTTNTYAIDSTADKVIMIVVKPNAGVHFQGDFVTAALHRN